MNPNLTELVYIIDRSGSMHHLTGDTVGGYNAFIAEQKKLDGQAHLTTVLFDDKYELFCDHTDIMEAKPMTEADCHARGCTALMDAVGKTINSVGARLSKTPEAERPSKVLFMIMTDGYENASKEFSRSAVKKMIEHQQSVYSWEFLFIGAGIDAYAEAASLGISSDHTAATFATSECVLDSINAFTCAASALRKGEIAIDASWKKDVQETVDKVAAMPLVHAVSLDSIAQAVNRCVYNNVEDAL